MAAVGQGSCGVAGRCDDCAVGIAVRIWELCSGSEYGRRMLPAGATANEYPLTAAELDLAYWRSFGQNLA